MAQDSILGAPLNTVGLSSRDKLVMEVAYCMGLNLAYFDMNDIYLETDMEINYAFSQAHHDAVEISLLPKSFYLVKVGNILSDTSVTYLVDDGKTVGMYLARREGNKVYLMGRNMVTLVSDDLSLVDPPNALEDI